MLRSHRLSPEQEALYKKEEEMARELKAEQEKIATNREHSDMEHKLESLGLRHWTAKGGTIDRIYINNYDSFVSIFGDQLSKNKFYQLSKTIYFDCFTKSFVNIHLKPII
jgi:hypothetical protein